MKSANNLIKTIKIENGKKDENSLDLLIASDVNSLVSLDNKSNQIDPEITLKEGLSAPIAKGDIVGTISYKVEGINYTTDLIAGNDVEEYKQNKIGLYILIFLILIIAILTAVRYYNLKKRSLKSRNKYINQ